MKFTNCCGAPFGYPGWPDCDLCSDCHEHAEPMEKEPKVKTKAGRRIEIEITYEGKIIKEDK